ncbi:MAG TPA: 2OG-Fe(II) oxygenase [Labilithrix sp.]|nr:2OG-Fe(II) oxygenase [Labilithrix sp.]
MSTRVHSALLTIGDPVPDLPLASQLGPKVSVHGPAFAGNPIVLLACRHLEAPAMAALGAVARLQDRFGALGARIMAVTGESIATNAAAAEKRMCRFPVLSDTLDRLLPMLDDTSGRPSASLLVIDRGLRIVDRFRCDSASAVEAALALCERMMDEERGPAPIVVQQAPVLLVPSVFPAALCARLVEHWGSAPEKEEDLAGFHRESGDPEVDVVSRRRPSVKRRTDWFVEEGPVHAEIRELLRRRVGPELRKAFDFTPGRCEQLRVGCYDAERGGYFRRHRDNVLGRRFSMSLNLNEDYEGGELCFPEYGRQLYRPPAGGALIFAAPLLHEVMEVRRGRRFVLVTFLCGKELPR